MRLLKGDEAADELNHGEVVSRETPPSDEQSTESIVPAVGAFDYPAAWPAPRTTDQRWLASASDVWSDASLGHRGLAVLVVVALVEAKVTLAATGLAEAPPELSTRWGILRTTWEAKDPLQDTGARPIRGKLVAEPRRRLRAAARAESTAATARSDAGPSACSRSDPMIPRQAVPRLTLAFAACAAALLASPAPTIQSPAADALAKAKLEFEAERVEDGVLLLRSARAILAEQPSGKERDALAQEIQSLLLRKDPVAKFFDAARRDAATQLALSAKTYAAKNWYRTALELAQRAAALDETTSREWLLELELKGRDSSRLDDSASFLEWFEHGRETRSAPAFEKLDWGVQASFAKDQEPGSYLLSALRAKSHDLRFESALSLAPDGDAGFVFGFVSDSEFHLVAVSRVGDRFSLSVARHTPAGFEELSRVNAELGDLQPSDPPEQAAQTPLPLPLSVQVRGIRVEASIGSLATTASLPQSPPHGALGFVATPHADGFVARFDRCNVAASRYAPRAGWRAEGSAGGQDASTRSSESESQLRERLRAANTEHAEHRRSEVAARLLRDLRLDVLAFSDGPRRHKLMGELEALLAQIDPDEAAVRKGQEASARSLLEQGQSYSRRRWARAALAPLEIAAQLSDEVAGRKLAEARTAAGNQGSGGTPVTDEWFAKGTKFLSFGEWKLTPGSIASPKLDQASVGFASGKETGKSYSASMEMLVNCIPGKAGLVFGLKPTGEDYYLLELRHTPPYSALSLMHYNSVSGHFDGLLDRAFFTTDQERAGFVDVGVRVNGDRLEVWAGELCRAETRASTVDIAGRIGLFVSGNSPCKDPVVFRNLRVE